MKMVTAKLNMLIAKLIKLQGVKFSEVSKVS